MTQKKSPTASSGFDRFAFEQAVFQSSLSPKQKFLALALNSFTSPESAKVWPSYDTLAEMCGMSRRHVMRLLSTLVEGGWILKMQRHRSGGGNLSNIYRLRVPIPNGGVTPVSLGGCHPCHPNKPSEQYPSQERDKTSKSTVLDITTVGGAESLSESQGYWGVNHG